MRLSDVFAAVAKLGVTDPNNPSPKDFKVVLDAYLKDKSLNTDVFSAYVKSMSAPLTAIAEGFAGFSADATGMSKRTVDVIERAMDVLQSELQRTDITADERRETLDRVIALVAEARDESERDRGFKTRLVYSLLGGAVVVGGVAVLVITAGKKPELLQKGLEIAAKAAPVLAG